jgi:uncharacterized protein YjbI with pentapeptide repeats
VKQGKEAIDAWWKAHPRSHFFDSEHLDLRQANLGQADLQEANLEHANLQEADLTVADLRGANLEHASLWRARLELANLRGANLERAYLEEADLAVADLRGANLESASLRGASLREANLEQANLRSTRLQGANMELADLSQADLERADLDDADLRRANLRGANLESASLSGANLEGANLEGANLGKAYLGGATLIRTVLDGAIITNACLWETPRAGWSIKGIICEAVYWDERRVYWDERRKELTRYTPGEFERLYADVFKIKIYYKGGIDLIEIATLPALIKQIEDKYPGCALRFQSIQEDAGGASVIIVVDNLGANDVSAIEGTAQRTQNQLREVLEEENKALRIKLDYVTKDILLSLLRQPTNQFNIETFQGNLLTEGSSMSEQHFHDGHFQGCNFGDHNSLTNYFGVVDKLDTVEGDIKHKLKEAREAIENAKDLSDADKKDAVDQLNNLTAELEKPEKDESRVKRYWNRIKEVAPTGASILASAASLVKLLGGG